MCEILLSDTGSGEVTRRGVLLDLVITKKDGLVGNVKARGSLGCMAMRQWNSGSYMEETG